MERSAPRSTRGPRRQRGGGGPRGTASRKAGGAARKKVRNTIRGGRKTDADTRRTGAHFLAVGSRTVARLVEAAQLKPGEVVLDAGAGLGSITKALSETGARVIAVENDPGRAGRIRHAEWPGVEVIESDILAVKLPKLDAIVANPPFRLVPAILRRMLEQGFARAILVVPEELAERLAAGQKTESYGKLTVEMGLLAKTRILFPAPKRDFEPVPAVACAVIHVQPKVRPTVDFALLGTILETAWEGKQRTLRHSLAPLSTKLGIPPQDISQVLELCAVRDRPFNEVSPWEYGNLTQRMGEAVARRRPATPAPGPVEATPDTPPESGSPADPTA